MIVEVNNKKDLNRFIYFVKELYKNDKYYVYPIFYSLKKELGKIVLHDKTYKALLCMKDQEVVGRLLFTYDYSKKQDKKICYYSYFDAINDNSVVKELFNFMEKDMKKH